MDSDRQNYWRMSLRDLDPDTAARIRALHAVDRRWNWVCLLYPTVWFITALTMLRLDGWWVQLAGTVVIGVAIQSMAILMHEALHGNLFRNQLLDRWLGFVLGAPAFFAVSAYRVAHLSHHRWTRTSQDQDELSNYVDTPAALSGLYYAWFLIGMYLYFLIVPVKALRIGTPEQRRAVIVEYALIFGIYALVAAIAAFIGHLDWVWRFWLLPAGVAIILTNVRGLAEHLHTSKSPDALGRSRTTTSNRLVSFLMCNLNYHLEHHLLPGVPWYHLVKAHRLLMPTYRERGGVFIHRSYLDYAVRALIAGPDGEIRDPRSTSTSLRA